MHHISSYLYDNRIQALLLDEDPSLKTRDRVVYSRTIKVYEKVDNVITVAFRNSDQKAANITAKSFSFSVLEGNAVVWSSPITISNVTTATGTVTLLQANVAALPQEYYNYAITYTTGNLALASYVDDNWGIAGQLQILRTVY